MESNNFIGLQKVMSKVDLAFKMLKSKKYKKMLEGFFSNPEHIDILYRRIIGGKTLQRTGDENGISRERVRQIEKKFLDKVDELREIMN